MKKVSSLFVFLFVSSIIYSTPLNWNTKASLYDHLIEVNKEWLKVSDNEFLCEELEFENDRERIQLHLQLVEKYLRQKTSLKLDQNQLKNRTAALDILNNYWSKGIFPKNTFHNVRQPYFIDIHGTACAVGYLALKTGERKLVNQIAEERNFAYVAELKDHYPQLLEWAREFGFTVDELAWIQPTYFTPSKKWYKMGNGGEWLDMLML